MGIGLVNQALLRDVAAKLPPGFSVCELGDQLIYVSPFKGRGKRGQPKQRWNRAPAEPFWRGLGCGRYETVDANGKASILADLNRPLDPFPGTFDVVTNYGTAEHVFNLAQVWATIHDLAKPGGWIATEQPTQGHVDHGFVCVQPTMIRDMAAANGWVIEHFEVADTPRGQVIRAIMRKTADAAFAYPTQGRYRTALKV